MNVDIDHTKRTTITLVHLNEETQIRNSDGLVLSFPKLNDSTIILAMLHQTLYSRLQMWENVSPDFRLELTITEVIK